MATFGLKRKRKLILLSLLLLSGLACLLIIGFVAVRISTPNDAGSPGPLPHVPNPHGRTLAASSVQPPAAPANAGVVIKSNNAAVPTAAAPAIVSAAGAPLNPDVLRQIGALEIAKAARTPAQSKLDSQLIHADKMRRGEPVAEGISSLRVELDRDDQGRVLTDIDAKVSDDLLQRIVALGGKVVNHFEQFNAIRALLPLAQIETLATREDVKFIRPAVKAMTNVGSVTSEGDIAHGSNLARTQFSVDGTGVKVGVLSDSVDHLDTSQASLDLGTVTVRAGQSGMPANGEGTAMLEIVHDVAPGAELFYATGIGGAASFAQNILDLRFQNGCDIIIDDITYANESPFQDGVIAQAVNRVTADGALYFSSAANSGNKSDGTSCTWEGDFVDGGDFTVNDRSQGRLHNFGGATQNTAVKGGRVNLFWADPLGAATNDYDLFVLNAAGTSIVAAGNGTQNGGQDPYEFVSKANDGEKLIIVKFSGAARFLHIDAGRGSLAVSTTGSTRGHNAAKDAFTVAAVDAKTSFPNAFTGNAKNPVETFSSDGLRRVFFNADGTPITPGNFTSTGGTVWQKPDIAAADGVLTTLPPDSGLNPFFGTSAAAPHAGAVAALLKSYNPALTAAQIRSILTGTALDIESPGVDRDSGAGIVMAVQALQAAPSADQPSITSFTPANGGVGANVTISGTKLTGVTTVKFNGVSATFTVDSAAQISTSVPAGATTGKITVTAPAGTATSGTDFTVLDTPAITSITPASGAVGTAVVLSGANFNGATAVQFNGVNAPAFTVNSATQVTVTVPSGAGTGRISVTTPAGSATSPNIFTVTTQPNITGFTPGTGGVGTSVVIDGANLNGATAVRFNGTSAPGFTVDSAIRITATVPAGAITGPLSVTTPVGSAASTASFTVVPLPVVTGFSPATGAVGAAVLITGSNFTGATAVRFIGLTATFTANAPGQISAIVPAGATTGTLSVTTAGGTATSAAAFTVLAPPANDNFANAQVIAGSTGNVTGTNDAATKEANEPNHGNNLGGKSVWYRWTAPGSGVWQFTTLGSAFDTELAIYTGANVGLLTLVASSDDTAEGTNSSLSFLAEAGTTYQIAVDGFRSQDGTAASTSSGSVALNWTTITVPAISTVSPPMGPVRSSVTITGGNLSGAGVTFNGVPASIGVNTSTSITTTVPVGATTGPLQVTTATGTAVSAMNFIVLAPPPNDLFASGQVITGNSGSVPGRNTDATLEANEPAHAGNPGGHSVWYNWTAPASGPWTFDTQGSGFDTVLAIYTGTTPGGLAVVGSNDDASPGTISRVAFTANSGALYHIAVDGQNGASGTLFLNWAFTPNPPAITSFAPTNGGPGTTVVLSGSNFSGATSVRLNGVPAAAFTVDSAAQITFTVPLGANSGPISVATPDGTAASALPFIVVMRPANDLFASSQSLNGSAAIAAGANVGATKESGEPNHASDAGGRSVWYRWTAPASGTWALDTEGSSFDTTLGVYTGSTVSGLTLVGANDDERADRSSRVTFTATAGTTYQIAVDGFSGDTGDLVLKLLPTLEPQVIYQTSFEATEGFSTSVELAGQGGWQKANTAGNGIANGVFPGFGQQAYIGVAPSFLGDDLYLWRAVDFIPQTDSRPVVQFSVLMGIRDSSNYAYDSFDWAVYNRSGHQLFAVDFDNYYMGVYYLLDDGTGYHFTGASFDNGPIYQLVVTMDFGRNRWGATLDGDVVASELPITTTGAALDLGDVDAAWILTNPFFGGDNAMVFDNYRLSAEPSPVPAIVFGAQNQWVTVGSSATFSVVASGGEPLQYQWRFNGTPLPGETSALLNLANVSPGQAGNYLVTVSNVTGSASSSAILTVDQPGPIHLTSASRLPDGRFQFTVAGTPGSRAEIEFSADLIHWERLETVVITGGSLVFADSAAGTQTRRFYRASFQP